MLATTDAPASPLTQVVFIVIGAVVIAGCILMLRNLEAVNSVFKGLGSNLFGERIGNRIYKPRNLIAPAIFGILIGVAFIVAGVTHLV